MAGKRKIERKRTTGRKTKPKKTNEVKQSKTLMDFGFTKAEEEEPLSVHIKPSPKKSPRKSRSPSPKKSPKSRSPSPKKSPKSRSPKTPKEKKKSSPRTVIETKDNDESINDEQENTINAAENGGDENEPEEHKNKYEVRQRVLARDEDGILYYGSIRRKLYGINHQKTISCLGIFDLAPEEISGKKDDEENDDENDDGKNEWHYFVHYEGWKTLWDRWISENDILDITPDNIERMKEITKTHRDFQLEFKEKTKKKKIGNGGLFLQQWKQKLDALNRRWDEKVRETENDGKGNKKIQPTPTNKRKVAKKKNNTKSPQEILKDRSKLALESCLTTRQPSHIQAIPLSFGLKRILVEDWENLNNGNFATDSRDENTDWDMVHVLPAKVTIRDALTLYLKEKGISWDGKPKPENNSNGKAAKEEPIESGPAPSPPTTQSEQTKPDVSISKDTATTPIDASPSKETIPVKQEDLIPVKEDNNGDNDNEKGVSIQLVKEWTDMADGIVLYFEQALMTRLLYPSEISQLLVLEDDMNDDTNDKMEPMKADIYGCEHLLRLLAAIPRILDQQLQDSRKRKLERKQKSSKADSTPSDENDQDEDAFVEIGSMILAKLQDLSRFLQKNQSALFRSMYRKKTQEEIKRDVKIQKRQERRLKSAAAAATAATLPNVQELQEQEK